MTGMNEYVVHYVYGRAPILLDDADVSDQISSKAAAIIALVLMRETRQMRRSDIISYLGAKAAMMPPNTTCASTSGRSKGPRAGGW